MKDASMKGDDREGGVWRGIVNALAYQAHPAGHARGASVRNPLGRPSVSAVVTVHGRASSITISVSWRDATACRYGEQIWREGIARRPGVCVLSNEQIEIGDCIYRPIPIAPRPANYHEMMLASVIEGRYALETDVESFEHAS